ncbi:hypothetical protein [Streptomyces sp. NPDC031705]|uniref:hypothetical protein n=1 Tax=Streptomyces sp. NPDC031705 TaxID=3155729 RepID=UPI003408ADA7
MRHRTAITAATGTLLALAPLTACAGGAAPSEAAAPLDHTQPAEGPGPRVQYAPESLDEPFDWVVPAAPGAAATGS